MAASSREETVVYAVRAPARKIAEQVHELAAEHFADDDLPIIGKSAAHGLPIAPLGPRDAGRRGQRLDRHAGLECAPQGRQAPADPALDSPGSLRLGDLWHMADLRPASAPVVSQNAVAGGNLPPVWKTAPAAFP